MASLKFVMEWRDSFRGYESKVLLYFTTLMSYRPAIKEVRSSLNSEALDQAFKFKPTDKMFEVGDDLYLTVPGNTQYASVQLTYKDGTKSPVQSDADAVAEPKSNDVVHC